MPLSEKTRQEMEAGARAVAARYASMSPDQMASIVAKSQELGDRTAALKTWERAGLITIETQSAYSHTENEMQHRRLHHVKGGPTFEDTPEALMFGGYPSELLIAQIALAITATGGGNG